MRRWTMTVVCFGLCLSLVGLASGQQQGGKKGFGGGGFGGFGGGGGFGNNPVSLLTNASVKKELDLSEEQVEKVPAAVMKALGDVLSAQQLKRFKEIQLQQRGSNALGDAAIQDALKLSEEQRGNIKTILDDSRKEQAALFQGGGGGGGLQEKLENFRKETQTKVVGVLNAEQKKAWRGMVGESFKLETGFGGGGGGGNFGKFKKKTDN